MLNFQNKKIFYTMGSGGGIAKKELNAVDRALLISGVANYNLIKISSILPPNAKYASKIIYDEGSLLPVAIAQKICEPTEEKLTIAAAIAVGIPEDKDTAGVIMEWSGVAIEELARENAISMVETAMRDRGISKYSIEVSSVEKESSGTDYVCAIAYVALFITE